MRGDQSIRYKLSTVKGRLEKEDIPWALFAGSAAYCYGSRRRITDIDILVRCGDLEEAKGALEGVDLSDVDVVCGSEVETDEGTCQFFFDDEMISQIQWKLFFGVKVPLIPVEDNIIFKAILQRGDDVGKHDVKDIWCMLQHEKIDLKYLDNRIRKCKAEERTLPLLLSQITKILRSRHAPARKGESEEMKHGFFRCESCGYFVLLTEDAFKTARIVCGKINKCPKCGSKNDCTSFDIMNVPTKDLDEYEILNEWKLWKKD